MDHRSNRSSKIEAKNRAKSGPRSRKKGIRVQLSIPSTNQDGTKWWERKRLTDFLQPISILSFLKVKSNR